MFPQHLISTLMGSYLTRAIILTSFTVGGVGSSLALAQQPPVDAELYVIWGHSEAGGHDKLDTAPKLENGDHIWAIKRGAAGKIKHRQSPPANTFGGHGPSPNNYFADELIAEGKANHVVLLKCPGGGERWQVGIKGAINDLNECTQMVKHAVEVLKLKLSGGVTYCCAGDALDEKKARAFSDNYKELVSAFRVAVGNPSLPFVSAMTPLTESCDKAPAQVEIIKLLRSLQADLKVPGVTWVDFHALGLPFSCFHLKGEEQARLGRLMAQAMR